jgi:O-Antigen ligase
MRNARQLHVWTRIRSWRFALLGVTAVLCVLRARDLPAVHIGFGTSEASITPADVAVAVLSVVALQSLARERFRGVLPVLAASMLFCVVALGTAAHNGSGAFVSGVKVCELAGLGLGAAAFIRTRGDLLALVEIFVAVSVVADAYGLWQFLQNAGGRQPSFLGEHDYAATATLPLVSGLAGLYDDIGSKRAWTATVAGGIGCILGAALASLVGLYLGVVALLWLVRERRRFAIRPLIATAATLAVITSATLALRAGSLGFLQSWFGKPPSRPGQYASSWSQRLIYTYIGTRIFVDHPLLGTGWWSNLPPKEFVPYLPDARRRFSDQPARYFPRPDTDFIPQQTYDEVLYELGIVGGVSFLAVLVGFGRSAVRAARRATELLVSATPVTWFAAMLGALAGEAFFGGTAVAALFWLVGGVALGLANGPDGS